MGEQAGDRGGSHPGTLTLACTKGLSRPSSPHPSLRRHGMQEAYAAKGFSSSLSRRGVGARVFLGKDGGGVWLLSCV